MAGPPEQGDLVTESGVFDDELSSGTQPEIGNDRERFNPVPKRRNAGPETVVSTRSKWQWKSWSN